MALTVFQTIIRVSLAGGVSPQPPFGERDKSRTSSRTFRGKFAMFHKFVDPGVQSFLA